MLDGPCCTVSSVQSVHSTGTGMQVCSRVDHTHTGGVHERKRPGGFPKSTRAGSVHEQDSELKKASGAKRARAKQQEAEGDGSDGPSPVASDPSSPTDTDDATAEASTVLVVEEEVLPPTQFTKGAASTALSSAGLAGVLKKPAAVRVPDGAQGGAGAAPPTLVATLSTGAACINNSCRDIVSILSTFVRL